MTIIAPTPPTFGIQIVLDDGMPIGILDKPYEASDAKQMLHRIQTSFPNSTLAIDEGFPNSCWVKVSDERATAILYRHTMHVLWTLSNADLPLAHWNLAPYKADKLDGTLHIKDIDKARKAMEAYAELFGVEEIHERTDERAIYLELGEVVWGGVQIKLSSYTSLPKDVSTSAGVAEQSSVGA